MKSLPGPFNQSGTSFLMCHGMVIGVIFRDYEKGDHLEWDISRWWAPVSLPVNWVLPSWVDIYHLGPECATEPSASSILHCWSFASSADFVPHKTPCTSYTDCLVFLGINYLYCIGTICLLTNLSLSQTPESWDSNFLLGCLCEGLWGLGRVTLICAWGIIS